MNNEEKILSILEGVQAGLSRLEDGQARLEGRVDKLEGRIDKLEAGQAQLRQDLKDLSDTVVPAVLRQENEVIPKLDALMESHTALLEKFLPERVERLESEMTVQRGVTRILTDEAKKRRSTQ